MKIGFIGLGLMGGAMAGRLRAAGFDVVVTDLSRQAALSHLQAGATWADTPLASSRAGLRRGLYIVAQAVRCRERGVRAGRSGGRATRRRGVVRPFDERR